MWTSGIQLESPEYFSSFTSLKYCSSFKELTVKEVNMMKTTVVICVVLATCQVLAAQEGWAERRWEARSNACESVSI